MDRIVFYITNHGFGHASRNVPIIIGLLKKNPDLYIDVKTDYVRCEFMKRNLKMYADRITYYANCTEVGFVLKKGTMVPDELQMQYAIATDYSKWDMYLQQEKKYLRNTVPKLVISDVVSWAIRAAAETGIKSLLIGNFTWDQMYRHFFEEKYWKPYYDNYVLAEKAIWYELHAPILDDYCINTQFVSFVSRKISYKTVDQIKKSCSKPIVFISNGASAELDAEISVEHLPYDFLITRGVKLIGHNVQKLPCDMINTPDYIAAADYIIAKGGWSTVAEILLQRKKCALIFRGENPEDDKTREVLKERGHCVAIQANELKYIDKIIAEIDKFEPSSYEGYFDSTNDICDAIMEMCGRI